MADILEEIVAYKKKEVEDYKKELKLDLLVQRTDILNTASIAPMSQILKKSTTGIIAEFKRKSPQRDGSTRMPIPASSPSVMNDTVQAP